MHPLLVSTFLDVAPDVLMPDSRAGGTDMETKTELIWTVGELASLIYGSVLRSETEGPPEARKIAQEGLQTVLARMSTYFPFGSQLDVKREVKVGYPPLFHRTRC